MIDRVLMYTWLTEYKCIHEWQSINVYMNDRVLMYTWMTEY